MTEKQVQITTIHYTDAGNVTLYETVDISTVRALQEIEFYFYLKEVMSYAEFT